MNTGATFEIFSFLIIGKCSRCETANEYKCMNVLCEFLLLCLSLFFITHLNMLGDDALMSYCRPTHELLKKNLSLQARGVGRLMFL